MATLLSVCVQPVLLAWGFIGVVSEYPWLEPGYWDTRSVIYARCESVDTTSERFQFRLTFRPFATLTGNVDSARDREFTARAYIGAMNTAITELPKVGSNYIVLVNKTEKGFEITSHAVGGYPGRRAIQEVKDFSDPLVESILDGLRELRSRPFKPLGSSTLAPPATGSRGVRKQIEQNKRRSPANKPKAP